MKAFNFIPVLIILLNFDLNLLFAQERYKLCKTNEKIAKCCFENKIVKGESFLKPVGKIGESIVYLFKDKKDSLYLYKFDEVDYNFKNLLSVFSVYKTILHVNGSICIKKLLTVCLII